MGSWRAKAAALLAAQGGGAQSPSTPQPPRRYADLPADLAAGLERLDRTPTARFRGDTQRWAQVVDDAHALALDGWAARALALGWSGHDVFGIGRRDANDFAGLAVWLDGRTIAVLDEQRAMARTAGGWACFERGGWGHGRDAGADPVLLWQFGRL